MVALERLTYVRLSSLTPRELPVLGAVSSIAASIAAVEGVKVISGFGKTLAGTILYYDARNMTFQRIPAVRLKDQP